MYGPSCGQLMFLLFIVVACSVAIGIIIGKVG